MKSRLLLVCLSSSVLMSRAAVTVVTDGPKGTEWESPQELGLNKLPPRAWFGHFPDADSAKGILMQESPWHRFLDSETEWRFRWSRRPEERPADFFKSSYDDSAWDVVKVPCSWQAAGIRASRERYGVPLYLNQAYPWVTADAAAAGALAPRVRGAKLPADWTFGPEDNPVGSYRRAFEVPADWKGMDVYLQFDGVESFFYLWINGRYVGFSKNSRSPACFDVTPYLKPAKNVLAVEVYRNCDGAYLEAQDMVRLAGIMRHVRLYAAPKAHIADVTIDTRPVTPGAYGGDWRVDATVEYRDFSATGGWPLPHGVVRARVFDANGRELELAGTREGSTWHADNTPAADINYSLVPLSFTVARPKLWSAEDPNLYTLVLDLAGADGRHVESVGFQLGFREVEIRRSAKPTDRVFLFNGEPIKTKGVNRGECDPLYGHYVPDEEVLRDIELVKRANMNHIRCSHFPQGEYFYYLCNRYGLYLMDEANLESHGSQYGRHSMSHREDFLAAHRDRVRTMYEWNKNAPAVILWSLGNEAGPGRNFRECYFDLHGRDAQGRPINWERNNSLVDIGSRQYPPVSWVRDVAAGTNTVRYPYHINEYAHDRLNNPNDLKAYQDAIESSDRIIGAAIWDFADQALSKKNARGEWIDAWGGDFGEKPVEREGGDGILEGIVNAHRVPEPSYWSAKYAYQNYAFALTNEAVAIRSKNFFVTSAAVRFEYRLLVQGRFAGPWRTLSLGVPLAPREERLLPLPASVTSARARPNAAIRFRAVQLAERNLVPADWTVAEEQFALSRGDAEPFTQPSAAPGAALAPVERDGVLTLGAWRFSKATGLLAEGGMTIDAFRYPVGGERTRYTGPGPQAIYREALGEGLREMKPTRVRFSAPQRAADGSWTFETEQVWRGVRRESAGDGVMCVGCRITPLGPTTETNTSFRATNAWRVRPDGSLDLDTTFVRLGRALDGPSRHAWAPTSWKILPRLGWRFAWNVTGAVDYFGCGPWENYPDRRAGAFPALWHADTVRDMGYAYTRSQDFGNRTDVKLVTVADAGFAVMARGRPFEMAVSPWSPTDLLTHDHSSELPTPAQTLLTVYSRGADAGTLHLRLLHTAKRKAR